MGVRAHGTIGQAASFVDVKSNLAEFAALGVEVAITELDVRSAALLPDEAGLKQQKRGSETIVQTCREVEGYVGMTMWDWIDKVRALEHSFDSRGSISATRQGLESLDEGYPA